MILQGIRTLMALVAVMACIRPVLASNTSAAAAVVESRDDPSTTRIGWLVDYCDDDWNIFPKYYFYGKCGDKPGKREWHHIDLTNCYTVTDQGELAEDNWRKGGMDDKCERCQRCANLQYDACLTCRCDRKDGGRHWSKTELDATLFWDGPDRWHGNNHQKICCGEWIGGPYCGEKGMPPEPVVPGIGYYLAMEGVD